MLRDRSRISKVAIVKDGAAMLPNTFVEMALGLSNVLTAAFFVFFCVFFTFNRVNSLSVQPF